MWGSYNEAAPLSAIGNTPLVALKNGPERQNAPLRPPKKKSNREGRTRGLVLTSFSKLKRRSTSVGEDQRSLAVEDADWTECESQTVDAQKS
ncbi:hypothetical protein RSK20926_20740 [Roseobacter sp. SK209-2-6]|nr:hypothetical protein RSK20926_20740 [Roseobacter sp. SK209-2-6]